MAGVRLLEDFVKGRWGSGRNTKCNQKTMWILPNQLKSLISPSVPVTEASTLDLRELSATCARSLTVRGKQPPSNSFSRAWKAGNLMRLRSGLICEPSRGQRFLDAWTSSLAVIPASHSHPPVSDSEQTTSDTSGLPLQLAFGFCDQDSASSRTSRDTSLLDCEKSLKSWKDSVTARRGEYSARLKSAHRTSASGSSSWPTIRASEYKDTGPIGSKSHDHMLGKGYLCAVVTQNAANWLTPQSGDVTGSTQEAVVMWANGQRPKTSDQRLRTQVAAEELKHGLPAQANPSTDGSRRELWPTPDATGANDGVPWEKFHASMMERRAQVKKAIAEGKTKQGSGRSPNLAASVQNPQWATPRSGKTTDENPETWAARKAKGDVATMPLTAQVKAWATPQTRDNRSGGAERWDDPNRSRNLNDQIATVTKQNAKLNPRWVEALMGLPIGWTMQSCATPVTIGQMNCECWGTE